MILDRSLIEELDFGILVGQRFDELGHGAIEVPDESNEPALGENELVWVRL